MGQLDFAILDLVDQPERFQIGHDLLAGLEDLQPWYGPALSFSVPSGLRMLIIGSFCRRPTS